MSRSLLLLYNYFCLFWCLSWPFCWWNLGCSSFVLHLKLTSSLILWILDYYYYVPAVMADENGSNNGVPVLPPAPASAQPVTLHQILGLLAPFAQQLDNLQGQVATLQKKKTDRSLGGSWLRQVEGGGDEDSIHRLVRHLGPHGQGSGCRHSWNPERSQCIDFVETKMRDVLCANTYGWDWVAELNAPPLSKGGDDESKFRKPTKVVPQKRLVVEVCRQDRIFSMAKPFHITEKSINKQVS